MKGKIKREKNKINFFGRVLKNFLAQMGIKTASFPSSKLTSLWCRNKVIFGHKRQDTNKLYQFWQHGDVVFRAVLWPQLACVPSLIFGGQPVEPPDSFNLEWSSKKTRRRRYHALYTLARSVCPIPSWAPYTYIATPSLTSFFN